MVFLNKGDFVWLDDPASTCEIRVQIGAQVIQSENGIVILRDDDGREVKISMNKSKKSLPTQMHVSSVQGCEDMIELGDLNEAGILRNLNERYKRNLIYTYTGSILVAVNPYQHLPIYGNPTINRYKDRRIGSLSPHIFAVADNAYHKMMRNAQNQCIIISGESGSGKTESTKLILQFFAALSNQQSWIEQQVLEANPILEAFGNARTLKNDNSSRFGKYINVHFDSKGAIQGARIDEYLLEKSRLSFQARFERNFHIFYCLIAGLSDEMRSDYAIGSAEQFNYVREGSHVTDKFSIEKDKKDFSTVVNGMKVLEFSERDVNEMMKLLCAMLHCGNIDFESIEGPHEC